MALLKKILFCLFILIVLTPPIGAAVLFCMYADSKGISVRKLIFRIAGILVLGTCFIVVPACVYIDRYIGTSLTKDYGMPIYHGVTLFCVFAVLICIFFRPRPVYYYDE